MSAENGGEVVDAVAVEESAPPTVPDLGALVPTGGRELAVTPQVQASELVERLEVIKQAQTEAMKPEVDYGVIPGTGSKPTLLKPGAEKLSVLFQLDVQLVNEKRWEEGGHLTVISQATAYHAPTGARLGYGEGICTTREKKHGKRKQDRACPNCAATTIKRSKYPPRTNPQAEPGWYCYSKIGGCGAEFAADDAKITSQPLGEVENPDLPDTWNTVVKMAQKRARVDVVLAVTGASALFTQDVEDGQPSPDQESAPPPEPPRDPLDIETVNKIGGAIGRLAMTWRDIQLLLGSVGAEAPREESGPALRVALEQLTKDQAVKVEVELEKRAQDDAATQPDAKPDEAPQDGGQG